MLFALVASAVSRHHHLQTAPTVAASVTASASTGSSAKLTSEAVSETGSLLGKYCALNSVTSRNAIQLTSPGVSVPLTVTGVANTLYCISMTNESDAGKVLWLYANVPTKALQNEVKFAEGSNFTDFGANTPIATTYQTANNLPAGYFGPINWNSYLNVVAGTTYNYKFNVHGYDLKTAATTEKDVITACGPVDAFLAFTSKFVYLLQAATLLVLLN